jgi:apolipoprotein N-acyltransferase
MLPFVASLLSGILLSFAFPKVSMGFIAWIAISPLMYYALRLSWKGTAVCSFAFGFGFFASLLYWMNVFGKLPWLALAIFQSIYVIGFAVTAKLLSRYTGSWGRFILFAVLWMLFEWLRSLGPLGFTWGDIGYSQYEFLPIAQLASVAGVWGVSLLVAFLNSAIANFFLAYRSCSHCEWMVACKQLAFSVIVTLALALAGWHALKNYSYTYQSKQFSVAVIQGNVPQTFERGPEYESSVWRTYTSMTLSSARRKPRLVVWPETVVPGVVGVDIEIQDRLIKLAKRAQANLLVGGWDIDRSGGELNTVFLICPERGIKDRYSKVRLVPFGEYVSDWVRRILPFLDRYKVAPQNITPGYGFHPIKMAEVSIGAVICFESIFPYISARMTAQGAQVLCVVTNDSWFGDSAAAEQHTAMSAIRAIENRRYLVHCATTGVSAVFDQCGRVISKAPLSHPAVLHAYVVPAKSISFYVKHGDWIIYMGLGLVGLLVSASVVRRKV